MPVEKKQLWADLALLSVAAVWGGTFVAVQNAVNQYPVFAFLALRFALATVGMCLLFGKRLRRLGWQGWGAGALIGVFLFVGYAFQTMGLKYTSATKAGLITGFQTVSVPIMTALLARRFPARQVILATILAVVGLGLLSIRGDMALEQGDLLVLICAISFGAHITAVGLLAPRMDAMALTIVQLAFVAIASAGVSLFTEGIPLPIPNEVGVSIAFTAILATCFAFGIQNGVSKWTLPTHTAVIFAMEPVFAALAGFLLAAERLDPRGIFGGCLILLATFVAEIQSPVVWARFVSRYLNPLFWSGTVLLAAALRGAVNWWQGLSWALFTIVMTTILPLVYMIHQLRRGVFSDFHITRREERLKPSLLLMVFLVATVPTAALWLFDGPLALRAVFTAGLVMVFVTVAITFFWKISQHVMGISSMAAMLTMLLGPFAAPSFLLVPIVAWARITVGAHTKAQTIFGALLGLVVSWAVFRWFGLA